MSSFWSILFLQLIQTTHHYTSGNLSTNYNLKHSKVIPMLVESFIHWQGYKHVLTWSEYLIYSNHVLPPLFSVTCYINTLLKMIAGYTSVKKDKTAGQWQLALREHQFRGRGNDSMSLAISPRDSTLTEVTFCWPQHPALRWRGNAWTAGDSCSSALWYRWCWLSWGR